MRSNRVCLKERWMWKSPWRRRDCRETYCCSWNSRDTCWVGLSTPLALFLPSLQESLQRVIRLFMKIGSLFELIISPKRLFSSHFLPQHTYSVHYYFAEDKLWVFTGNNAYDQGLQRRLTQKPARRILCQQICRSTLYRCLSITNLHRDFW